MTRPVMRAAWLLITSSLVNTKAADVSIAALAMATSQLLLSSSLYSGVQHGAVISEALEYGQLWLKGRRGGAGVDPCVSAGRCLAKVGTKKIPARQMARGDFTHRCSAPTRPALSR